MKKIRGRKPTVHKWISNKGGGISLRLPKQLHKNLIKHCLNCGVSLNTLISALILRETKNENPLTHDYIKKLEELQIATRKKQKRICKKV